MKPQKQSRGLISKSKHINPTTKRAPEGMCLVEVVPVTRPSLKRRRDTPQAEVEALRRENCALRAVLRCLAAGELQAKRAGSGGLGGLGRGGRGEGLRGGGWGSGVGGLFVLLCFCW